jgi:O-antigen/teichoic acid export membrane protein
MNLKQKTVQNIGIVFIAAVFTRLIKFVSTIILARILLPEDFGLVAIASIFLNLLDMFKDLGVGNALIYKKEKVDDAADTAFIIIPLLGAVLFAIAYFSAPFAAIFFGDAIVTDIIRVSAITFLLAPFGSVPSILFEKNLDFKKSQTPQIISSTVSSVLSIFLALVGFGVWSLIYSGLIGAVTGLLVIWKITPWRPRLRFDLSIAKELFGYGKHILASSFFIFLATNLDSTIIGRLLGVTALGLYSMAYRISNYPVTNVTYLISGVMFPTYSKLHGAGGKLKKAYLMTFKYVSLLSIPASFGILIITNDFVQVVMKPKWGPIIPIIQILCFYGLVRSLGATTGEIFKATGKPKLLAFFTAMSLGLFVLLVIPAITFYGVVGVCVITTFSEGFTVVFALREVNRILGISLKEFSDMLKDPFVAGSLALLVAYLVKLMIYETSWVSLFAIFISYSITYILLIYLLDKKIKAEVTELIKMLARR